MAFDYTGVLYQLEQYGLYDFILPFLLIFAVIFGILSYMEIFGNNKGIHVLIAIVIGLLASRFAFFGQFLNELFPRLGVGIVIILAVLILLGLFVPEKKAYIMGWILMGVAAIIALVIFGQVYDVLGGGSYLNDQLIGGVILVGLLIGVIVAIVVGNNSGEAQHTGLGPMFGGSRSGGG